MRPTVLCVSLLLLIVGCGDYRALNENNTYYQQAEKARREGDFQSAIAFYERCLQFSPSSDKAHLQLAILYEEQNNDFPRAIIHYKEYILAQEDGHPEGERMLRAVEEKYYRQLRPKYELKVRMEETKAIAPPLPEEPPAPPPPPEPVARPEPKPEPEPEPQPEPKPVPETPVQREPKPPQPTIYVVEAGDNLSRISNKVYGTSRYWDQIYEANRHILSSPEKVRVGQKLIIPDKSILSGE